MSPYWSIHVQPLCLMHEVFDFNLKLYIVFNIVMMALKRISHKIISFKRKPACVWSSPSAPSCPLCQAVKVGSIKWQQDYRLQVHNMQNYIPKRTLKILFFKLWVHQAGPILRPFSRLTKILISSTQDGLFPLSIHFSGTRVLLYTPSITVLANGTLSFWGSVN